LVTICINIIRNILWRGSMSAKALLQTYIIQGKEYKKMLEKVNYNGCHTAKIKAIDKKLKIAAKTLKQIKK
jgi:hypothetical protein